MKKRNITTKQMYDILSANTGLKPKTLQKVIKYFRLLIIEELRNHGTIYIDGIGTFKTYDYGGKDYKLGFSPTGEKVFVPKTKKIGFNCSPLLEDCVNNKPSHKKGKQFIQYDKKYQHRFMSDQMEDYVKPLDEIAESYLDKKTKKKRGDINGENKT